MKQANKWLMQVLASLMVIGVAPLAMAASEMCVSTTNELNGALILAQFAPQTIKLVQGTYSLAGSVWHNADFGSVVIKGGSSLLGGYTTNCTGRDIAAENTVITDSSSAFDNVSPLGNLTVEGLSWHTSLDLEVSFFSPDIDPDSELVLRRNVFEGAQNGGLVVEMEQDESVTLRVVDTLIHDSKGDDFGPNCAFHARVLEGALDVELINNTVVSNSASGGGVCLTVDTDGSGSMAAFNNIFYGNSGPDLRSDSTALLLVDNVIGSHNYPSPFIAPVGTLAADPKLDSNFRPIESPVSPVINSGTEDVSGGLPATDLDGRARVIGGAPDRGAYESNINNAFVQTVTNTNDSGNGSLREAMINANAASGFNIISFDIGSSCGPHVITLASPLPSITSSVFINGYSQTGSAQNDLDSGDDAVICIVLESGDDSASTALRVGSSVSSSVYLDAEGMAFSGFNYAALDLKGGSDHVVAGNHFGGSVGGVTLLANETNIWIGTGVAGATIGGDDVSQRNIISGANYIGIRLAEPAGPQLGANQNQIINNYIGTTHTGNSPFENDYGIEILGDHNTLRHNIISGNSQDGILISGTGAHNNLIDSNVIGSEAFGNGNIGVNIINAARDNTIVSNTIANNLIGMRVVTGVHNRISKNSILLNSGLGIDLAAEGVTVNDDDGAVRPIDYANDGLNFPVLTQTTGSASSGVVGGMLTTEPGTYTVELFVSGDCDYSGHGEGETWRRTITVTIPDPPFGTGQGTAAFTTSIKPGDQVTLLGKLITATASSATGDTSEFSACRVYTNDTIFADGFEATP